MKSKKVLSKIIAITAMASVASTASVSAENIGMCTHMSHTHTGNTISGVIEAAESIKTDYIRDELRWGWGMQASANAQLQMPAAYWIDDAEKAGMNSLVILGFSNTVFGKEGEIPTPANEEYFNKFLDYVRFVVKNCKGKVEAYEIWNEPNHGPFNYQIANGLSYEPKDYVDLVSAVSEIIRQEDEDAKVVGGSYINGGTITEGWVEGLFEAGIGDYIDAFSFHVYTHKMTPEQQMRDRYDDIEAIMKQHGFKGEIWLTETGYFSGEHDYAVTEDEQASYAIRTKVLWDDFLRDNGRDGEFFWYNLRCGGQDITNAEHNFGVIDYNYNPKPVFYSVELYNELLEDRVFEGLESSGYTYNRIKNQAKYKDEVTGDYTHILYKGKNASGSKTVALSGDVAYLYDYQGNVINTYNDTNQSITVTLTEEPKIVHCVSYKASIENVEYDSEKNICIVSGKTNIPGNEITITLEEAGKTVQTETLKVENGKFKGQFSPVKDGTFILSAGKGEIEDYYAECEFSPKRDGIKKAENIEYGISATYNEETTTVTLSGVLTDADGEKVNGTLNALVVKDGTDINSVTVSDVVYMVGVKVENGEFDIEFEVLDSLNSKYNLYLRTESSDRENDSFGISENGRYAYTFDFSKDAEALQVKASVSTAEENEAVVIISQYDDKGRLVEAKTQSIKTNTESVQVSTSKNSDAKTYRAFMWNSFTGMKPIIPMTEIK